LSNLELSLAFRYLRSRGGESFRSVISLFSLIGIALGVAALIVVMSVMNGFRTELTKQIIGFDGDIEIYSSPREMGIENYSNLITDLKQNFPNINKSIPLIKEEVLFTKDNNIDGAIAKALALENFLKTKAGSDNLIKSENFSFENNEIIIGHLLAEKLNIWLEDELQIMAPNTNSTIIGAIPRHKTFIVKGIFNLGMSEYDSSTIFIPLSIGQKLFKYENKVNMIEIFSDNYKNSPFLSVQINKFLREKYSANSFLIKDWQNKNASFFNALKTERVAMFTILTLIILVAAFNIISSLIMLVKDKTKDIAILKTLGATRGMIIRIFIFCGFILGAIGSLLGLILGLSFAYNIENIRQFLQTVTGTNLFDPLIYYLSQLPVEINLYDIATIVILSLALSFLATIYPAFRAARLDPVEALRG